MSITTRTWSTGSPSRSAATFRATVACPWPCGTDPSITVTPPLQVHGHPHVLGGSGLVPARFALLGRGREPDVADVRPGRVDDQRDPDAVVRALGAGGLLTGPQLVQVGVLGGQVERGGVVAGVVHAAGGRLVREAVDQVAAAHLEHVAGRWRPRRRPSAVPARSRAAGRRSRGSGRSASVRDDGAGPDPDGADPVGPGDVAEAAVQRGRFRRAQVGADVVDEVDPQRGDRAVRRRRRPRTASSRSAPDELASRCSTRSSVQRTGVPACFEASAISTT